MAFNQDYWNKRYIDENTGWDMGQPSPPLVEIFNSIHNKDAAILIPGCGNAYEANYLLEQGFTNITLIDIAPKLVQELQKRFQGNASIQIICQDFFEWKGKYDYIIEQTFFCAIDPSLRSSYVQKMNALLKAEGILTGLMFNKSFEKEGPPFGGNLDEYQSLFSPLFDVQMKRCENSIPQRLGSEILVTFTKN